MLGIFANFIMPWDKPTYYAETSVMNQAGFGLGLGFKLNPGLGFRPQLDVEDTLIRYNPAMLETSNGYGFKQYVDHLKSYLNLSIKYFYLNQILSYKI